MNCRIANLVIAFSLLACIGLTAGCEDEPTIRTYNVPPMTHPQRAANTHVHQGQSNSAVTVRMVAAIVPRADRVWFFKAVAPEALIGTQVGEIRQFIESVNFVANVGGDEREPKEIPQWTLPQGWTAAGKSGMRYDTITIGPAAHPIELTITPLGPTSGDIGANVRRWAGQVGVENATAEQIADYIDPIVVSGKQATFVNIPSTTGGSGTQTARQPDRQPDRKQPPNIQPKGDPFRVIYKKPDGWEEQRAGGMRMAAFKITDGDASAEVTVIPLPMNATDIASPIANIDRWRGQVGLPPLTEEQINENKKAVDADQPGAYFSLIPIGKRKMLLTDMQAPASSSSDLRIVGAMDFTEIGYIYFYKMTGPADLVGANKDKFLALLKSVTYEP